MYGNVAYRAKNTARQTEEAFMSGSGAPTTHALPVPGENKKVSVEMELVPSDKLPSSLHSSPNIAKVNLGGKEFFAVIGKTAVID